MLLNRRRCLQKLASITAASTGSRLAWSQSYPALPVRLIVPFAPGGPDDLAARLIAQGLSDQLGKQFYVENIAGAGGNVGTGTGCAGGG